MGKRILSAIILLIIFIPIIKIGGNLYNYTIYITGLMAINEFLNIKNSRKEIPITIKALCFILFSFLILSNINGETLMFSIDYRILSCIFLLFTIPTIIYHDRKKYSINDALYMIGGILFLGISFSLMIVIRNMSIKLIIYLFLISTMTDTYSYITGNLIGKKELLKEISPCKTIEGMIGGIVFGTFIPTMYYITVINNQNTMKITLITLFLSILATIGDLFFSAIKRYFEKKDFSKIIPGHGGILDRFDSIIFIILGFTFFINIIGG